MAGIIASTLPMMLVITAHTAANVHEADVRQKHEQRLANIF